MPIEVISLLSSSPVIPPSRGAPPTAKPLSRAPTRLHDTIDEDDDLKFDTFDLTADSQNNAIIRGLGLGGDGASKSSKSSKSSNATVGNSVDLLLSDYSNDDDDDDDDNASNAQRHRKPSTAPADGRASKRVRLSPPTEKPRRPEAFETWSFSRLNSESGASKPKGGNPVLGDDLTSSPPKPRQSTVRPSGAKNTILDDLDLFSSSPPNGVGRQPPTRPSKTVAWDPISSSAPLLDRDDRSAPAASSRTFQRTQSEVITLDDSDDLIRSDDDEEDEFPDITKLDAAKLRLLKASRRAPSQPSSKSAHSAKARSTSQGTSTRARAPAAKKSVEDREREKDKKAAEKLLKEKEKQRQREEKALEKQRAAALAAVNKVRTDKKVSTPEMIVDLPSSLNPAIILQAETLLQDLDVESFSWDPPVENVVRWRRKVRSRYNEELEHWEPIPMRIDQESYAMVIMPASQFVQLALGTDGTDLEAHATQMTSHFANHTVIYLIEGLTPWLRKNRSVRNRQFTAAVRSGMDGAEPGDAPPSGSQQPRRRKADAAQPQQYIDEDMVEDALLQMQVLHGVLIHHTAAAIETAQWIAVFTQHISTVPYRRQRDDANASSAGFCMEAGQVRTGDGARDTYMRMLQEVARVTNPISYGIANEFATVSRLVEGLEKGGPLTLEDVRRSANKDGAYTDRTVGPSISRRLYKIFTGMDETSTDI